MKIWNTYIYDCQLSIWCSSYTIQVWVIFVNIGILLFVQVLHSIDFNEIMVKIQYMDEQRTRQINNQGKKAQQLKPRNKARETKKIQH